MTQPATDISVQENVNLAPFNTLHVEAEARFFLSVGGEDQLRNFVAGDLRKYTESGLFVLGGGSNVLFAKDFDGLILHIDIKGREVVRQTDKHVWLRVGAGESWHETVLYCVEQGWGGIENLSLIPGTVGAAPIQNIGAYGVELQDVFEELEAVEVATGETKTFNGEACRFGYRDSIFKNELKGAFIISSVTIRLSKNPVLNTEYGAIRQELAKRKIEHPTIRDISAIVIDIRNSKLPRPEDLGNAGSFFKNPILSQEEYEQVKEDYPSLPAYPMSPEEVKVPAGWLIEQAGWKGRVVGRAGTYKQQALVIVNHGGATAKEILELSGKICESVKQKFGIALVPEVNIVS